MNFSQKTLTFLKLTQNKTKSDWQSFWAIFGFKIYLFLWLIIAISNWLFTYILVKNLPQDNINLHYNIIFGIDLIGPPIKLYLSPLIGMILGAANFVLAANWLKKDRLLTHLGALSAIIINLLISLGIYSSYLINFVNIKF